MLGLGSTVKLSSLLGTSLTLTTTLFLHDALPFCISALMLESLQFFAVTPMPPKVSVLLPCAGPTLIPESTTEVPTGPKAGERLAMLGVGSRVKLGPALLLRSPFPVTVTTLLLAPA